MHRHFHTSKQGFTLIELLVTIAVTVLVFGGIASMIQITLRVISNTKASTSALALANERMESIRALPYASIGTVSGIPSGSIPQHATATMNGISFNERVLIQYVDSPDDGFGAADSNGILADYKQIKVEYSWLGRSGTSSVFLLSDITPPSIESTTGGGTLTVNVFDASVQPVSGADVRLYNDTTTSTIDVTRFTDINGVAMFAGAPAAANYQITVTKSGYSTDKTYSATTSNPNPTTQHVAVLLAAVSTMNFQIDELSSLRIKTIEPTVASVFDDAFDDVSKIENSTDVVVNGGIVELAGGSGAYVPSGIVKSIPTTPGALVRWDTVTWEATTPSNTGCSVQVFSVTGTSTYTLVPEGDLPGNTLGFTTGIIDISKLSTSTYPSLALQATLTSSDVNVTSELDTWTLGYIPSEVPIGSVPFTLTGAKTIGTTATLAPVFKYSVGHTTEGSGSVQIDDLEWDSYDITLDTVAYTISEVCSGLPYALDPDVSDTLTLELSPATSYALRIPVTNWSGNSVVGAEVTVSRSGFTATKDTSVCGQVFFSTGLGANPDYTVTVSASGYVTQVLSDVSIDGVEVLPVSLTSI